MSDASRPINARAVFAAVALHKLLAGMDDPEEHFHQMEDSYTDLCQQAWRIADRMVKVGEDASYGGQDGGQIVPVAGSEDE